jgi:raffinose/stachyose/melibiose transport system substrate-binding protein
MKCSHKVFLSLSGIIPVLLGCSGAASFSKNSALNPDETATLTICGDARTNKPLEDAIIGFNKIYPHCKINYEYVMDYDNNIQKRLKDNDTVDCFLASKISASSLYLPYADDFSQESTLNLSDTFDGLMANSATATGDATKLYFLPFGGEIRGMFVNNTLLNSRGLKVPTNYTELLSVCDSLAGEKAATAPTYVPLQGNPGNFGLFAFYPYVASSIANAEDPTAVHDAVANLSEGVEEYFREPLSRLYHLVEKYYYNYDYAKGSLGNSVDSTPETACYDFLNIRTNEQGARAKADDIGNVPFFPWTQSLYSMIERYKDDFNSKIDFSFILSPFGDKGGYGYLSPSNWIALNKDSKNKAWSLEFLNYLFSNEGNRIYAESAHIIPNTKDAFNYVKTTFNVPLSNISHVGQASFTNEFYNIMKKCLIDISKANRESYMIKNEDGTYSMHPFSYYMENLKADFAAQRSSTK